MLRQHTVEQLARVGGHSVGIVVLVVFVVGAVISMQIGPLLRDYGVVIMIADVAGIGFLRELGPMLTAVVLSGYAGASIAAELGTMKVGEKSTPCGPWRLILFCTWWFQEFWPAL